MSNVPGNRLKPCNISVMFINKAHPIYLGESFLIL